MIYELRIYTCKPGSVGTVLQMWQDEGQAMIAPYMKMIAQWTSESGIASQIYTIWQFESLNHRQEAREALLAHAGFAEYLARCREFYTEQEAIFLSETALSPLKNYV